MDLQKTFGLGTTGQWVKLGRGVLGRVMPYAMAVVILEAILGLSIAAAAPEGLLVYSFTVILVDFLMFVIAFLWAHHHPAEAASEGKEIADIRRAEFQAMKFNRSLPPSPNVPDPRLPGSLVGPPVIGQLSGEAHATMANPPALPKPNVTAAEDTEGK